MEIEVKKELDIFIIKIIGRLDAVTTTEFEAAINGLIAEGGNKLIFDMGELQYVSSAGLRSFLGTAKSLKAGNGLVAFFSLQESVNKVFQMSGFNKIFKLFNSMEEATKFMNT
ncbi:MAG: STAS domain-containing protein [Nitrospirae bacterium]|nr:STAS domain-containing protein [Nitrospirota bacterium]